MVLRTGSFNELRRMQDTMDRLWRGYGGDGSESSDSPHVERWAIPVDVLAKGDDIIVRASMPDVSPGDIEVTIEENVLTIRGQSVAHDDTDSSFLMRERRVGAFYRSLRLPDTVDTDKANSSYENGMLTVTIPKAESKKARKLQVQLSGSNGK